MATQKILREICVNQRDLTTVIRHSSGLTSRRVARGYDHLSLIGDISLACTYAINKRSTNIHLLIYAVRSFAARARIFAHGTHKKLRPSLIQPKIFARHLVLRLSGFTRVLQRETWINVPRHGWKNICTKRGL